MAPLQRVCRFDTVLAISAALVAVATCQGAAGPGAASCPNSTQILSRCLWDGKVGRNQLRNFSCVGPGMQTGSEDCVTRCCSACHEDVACQSWTYASSSVAPNRHPNTCFLTTDTEAGDPGGPPGPGCTSAYKSHPQPAPVSPPPGARNVLMIVVDDMRTQMNESYNNSFMITPNL